MGKRCPDTQNGTGLSQDQSVGSFPVIIKGLEKGVKSITHPALATSGRAALPWQPGLRAMQGATIFPSTT